MFNDGVEASLCRLSADLISNLGSEVTRYNQMKSESRANELRKNPILAGSKSLDRAETTL